MYKFGEPYMVVAAFGTHVATNAGPDRIILRYVVVLSQPSLRYKTGVKIWVVLGNRTHHGALATVEAEAYPGIAYFSFRIEQLAVISSLSMNDHSILYMSGLAEPVAAMLRRERQTASARSLR